MSGMRCNLLFNLIQALRIVNFINYPYYLFLCPSSVLHQWPQTPSMQPLMRLEDDHKPGVIMGN